MSSFIDFVALKERVSVEAAISLLGLNLKQRNGQWRGPCPVCKSGGDRALVITPAKNAFYCFGSRTGGDVIAFAAHIRECDAKQAAAFLAGDGGEEKQDADKTSESGNTSNTVPEERNKGDTRSLQPLTYLQPDHECVRALGLYRETCEFFGAGYAPKGIMRGRLAIPIHDNQGTLVAYCGRTTNDENPGLIFPKDFDPATLVYNAHNVTEAELVLLRDPLEVMLATQNGIDNVVSFLTDTIRSKQLHLLAKLMDECGCESLQLA